jgi:23S rRNA pseudouridine1911/1915/1917 synthase
MDRLLEHLAARFPLAKKTSLKRMVEEGRVTINGRRARTLKEVVGAGDQVKVAGRAERPKASIAPLEVVHEDDDLLVVHKPAGLLTSTNPGERRATADQIIRKYLADREPRARVGIIHRLDRDASGLLVFSKNHAAFEHLKRQFFEHSVERVYLAVVRGTPPEDKGRIESRLVEWADGSVHSTRAAGKGQKAVTEYEVVGRADDVTVLRVRLETGRKHQIRAHLAEMGSPIVGDAVYGEVKDAAGRLHLAAVKLGVTHPRTGQWLVFEVAPPSEIARWQARCC